MGTVRYARGGDIRRVSITARPFNRWLQFWSLREKLGTYRVASRHYTPWAKGHAPRRATVAFLTYEYQHADTEKNDVCHRVCPVPVSESLWPRRHYYTTRGRIDSKRAHKNTQQPRCRARGQVNLAKTPIEYPKKPPATRTTTTRRKAITITHWSGNHTRKTTASTASTCRIQPD